MVMQAAIPLYDEAETFYRPYFEVYLAGQKLAANIVRDVVQVTYKDNSEEIDSFELVIANWDSEKSVPKYEPYSDPMYKGIFDPGKKLELWMGYVDNLRLMLKGEITTLEPNFPEAGGPTLTVRGLNVLHTFRKKQHTWAWENVTDSSIAKEIASRAVSDSRPGLGKKVRLNDQAAADEKPETFVFMNNQYDIVFLMERARRRGYSIYVEEDPKTKDETIYFGPSEQLREITYELTWGKSLSQFRPTLTTTRQVSQVTVMGWNRRTRRPIVGRARVGDRGVNINSDQNAVQLAVEGRQLVITDEPVHTQQEADAKAKDRLRDLLKEMVKGAGATVGLPDLRCGRKIIIKGLGERFSGTYFVTDTTHTIGNGYRTTFNARREGP